MIANTARQASQRSDTNQRAPSGGSFIVFYVCLRELLCFRVGGKLPVTSPLPKHANGQIDHRQDAAHDQ